MKNTISFNENGKLRILQVSDPQDLKFVRKAMVEMLDKAYDTLKPDLVVFTGDNILGNHLLDARIGSRKTGDGWNATVASMKAALACVLEPVERRKIPFAMIYGNHDDMNVVSKKEQMSIYRSYEYCMDGNMTNSRVDCDTYVVKVYDGKKPAFLLYMLDSAWQDEDGERKCHEEIKKETVRWFKETNARLRKSNGGEFLPAIVFTHIPLPAMLNLTEKCNLEDDGSMPDGNNGYYRLNPALAKGYMGEPLSIVKTDNGLFDAMVKDGNVKAVVTGHDHTNCFEGSFEGVDFLQTGCASFRCYGNKDTRGVRVIDINKDGTYETKFYTYYDLCGNSLREKAKYFRDADEHEVQKFSILGGSLLAAVTGITAAVIGKYIRK